MRSAPPDRHLIPGDPPVAVAVRRSARARRLTLRVSRLDGRVTLTLPQRLPWREALDFLTSREGWLRDQLARGADVAPLPEGSLPFQGGLLTVQPGAVRRLTQAGDVLHVPDGSPAGPRVQAFLKAQARDQLAQACDTYAARLGRPYRRLTLRDTRSRWGSCSTQGDLMFSWRLIMAPSAVLDYVAAHEVAHLAEMNHAPAFWAVVARLCPEYQVHRHWLRDNGDQLHRVRFDL